MDLVELIEATKDICEIKDSLVKCIKAEIASKGLDGVNTSEAGEVIDMIKDLAETEEKCFEKLYYQKVVEAMTSYEEPRYGYNINRYSNGRFAPSGHGTNMGYMPRWQFMDRDGETNPKDYMQDVMMGYSGNGNSSNSRGNNSGGTRSGYTPEERYGQAYNDYKRMRKFYTETKSEDDKREMEMRAEEHIKGTIMTARDIWRDADPVLRKRMKEEFTKLVNDMNTQGQ